MLKVIRNKILDDNPKTSTAWKVISYIFKSNLDVFIESHSIPKGQLISKWLFGFFNSPKKWTKNFCPSRLGQKLTFSSSFFGRIEDTKISFRDYLTFTTINLSLLINMGIRKSSNLFSNFSLNYYPDSIKMPIRKFSSHVTREVSSIAVFFTVKREILTFDLKNVAKNQ